ncbi:MAG TPA: dihydrolipoyl dehydrogenase [Candidatus Nanoarchaeia archaeon]|nr:dihydrolipoyl dehydrogenase [Candidatus Nanoarchaeia archaeon]
MQTFDLIVIGAGSGLNISSKASEMGLKVAIIEKGPMGGTCLNRGCIPSKIIIHSADVAETIRNSKNFGISSKISSVDFRSITSRASSIVDSEAKGIKEAIEEDKNTTLFNSEGKFIGDKTLKVGNETIKGKKIVIAAGTRPLIPNIEGLDKVDFMTSTEALRLENQPKTLTILGGGYIATELAHFYGSLGTKINIIQRNKYLIPNEDEDIAKTFTEIWKKKYNILLNHDAVSVKKKSGKYIVEAKEGKKIKKVVSDKILVAVGRIPNTDVLDVEKTGVKTNEKGYINTNEYLQTTEKNIWALGDIVGNYLFKHSANLEAEYVYNNALLNRKAKVDYTAMPHAIFSSPQVAGVGFTENQLNAKKISYAKGIHRYIKTGMGQALQDRDGFVKILAGKKTKKILGCYIIGTDASTLIHEVLIAMKYGISAEELGNAVHIHPALSEVVQRAAKGIEW